MTVLVTGSRGYEKTAIMAVVIGMMRALGVRRLIHGAARGADTLAADLGARAGMEVIACPADWEKYGRAAGPIRNQEMLDTHQPDAVVAFPTGGILDRSRGTHDMVKRARKAGVPTFVVPETLDIDEAREFFRGLLIPPLPPWMP